MKDVAYNAGLLSAVSGAMARLQALDVAANNLANAKTIGFKRDIPDFESRLIQAQRGRGRDGLVTITRLKETRIDRKQGDLETTGNPFDLGIDGPGFFKVRTPAGDRYTRQGNLTRDNQDRLVTAEGYPVLGASGPITVSGDGEVEISEDGSVLIDGQEAGVITLYEFPAGTPLEKVGDGLFIAPKTTAPTTVANPRLIQGALEAGNVNVLREMTRMVTYEREFETYQKMIKAYGQMATKAAELGAF
ncbi:flagellar basal-body rod protein FlgF [Geothermobacter hydrogeniphilus]|uniref:Flagellar basal-body rod protein FlgF n=1 Tax=Geothermobacter hydrogeniphilus TaxID=1969733 RepID=A0A2K2HCX4_9BACT|nr:flagellar basal-body rod protein FlgF [Geothermobacter hydrogeniphilus]PNU21140.1 flagellar basal-body rod protein FlgF [Geothermobacter hydrogeniphilus]